MAGKVSRFLLLQNTILIEMIKEIKRKWNQHTCIASPQNKDYWRNCWAFLELQTTRKTIQTDAVLGYKTSPLVCFCGIFIWTVCSVFCSSKCYRQTELMTKMFWIMLSTTTDGDWNPLKSWAPGTAGMQQQWRLDHNAPNAAQEDWSIFRRWGPKAPGPEKPHAPLPCQLSHNDWFCAWF